MFLCSANPGPTLLHIFNMTIYIVDSRLVLPAVLEHLARSYLPSLHEFALSALQIVPEYYSGRMMVVPTAWSFRQGMIFTSEIHDGFY